MTRAWKNTATIAAAAALLVLGFVLDPLIAGKMPSPDFAVSVSRFLSLLGNGVVLFPVCAALYALGAVFKDFSLKSAGKDGFVSVLLSGAAAHILKAVFERPRIPHSENAVLNLLENPSLFDLGGRFNSLPSGHSAAGFAIAYALSQKYPRYRALFYSTAALIAASRVWLGAHYPSDVAAGALLGILSGYLAINRIDIRNKRILAGIALLVVSISFFKTGGFLLFDIDEAVFSEAAREMAETGDVITPTYNYEPRYDKPAFIYWAMSSAFKLFGVNEFAARFTSGLFGSLLALMTFFFVRRLKGRTAAIFATLALILNIEYFVYTHSAVTDMTLAFFIAAAVYSFYLYTVESRGAWTLYFWAACGFATITKGAIGVLFPVVTACIYLFIIKDLKRLKALASLSRLGLYLLITVPWFAAEFYINGWEFFNAFVVKHHIQRYSGVISSHGGPFYYYLGVLAIGFFPWAAFLPGAVYRALRERSRKDYGLELLSAVWLLTVLAFFSIARTKLPNYIFPLFPPAAVLAGLSVSGIVERRDAAKDGLYLTIILSAALGAALFIVPSLNLKMPVAYAPHIFHILGGIFLAIAAFAFLARHDAFPFMIGIGAMMVMLLVFLRLQALPKINAHLQKTLYTYSVYAKALGSGGVLATYEINKPSIAFYAGRKTLKAEKATQCDIRENLKLGKEMLVITDRSHHAELAEFTALKLIASDGEYMLLGNSDRLPPFEP